jgi:hypothetical protein
MTNFKTEILDGTTFYSTENARGNVTTVWSWGENETYVQVNSSQAKFLGDIKKPSKEVKNLIAIMGV